MVVRDALTVRRRHKWYETRGARRLAKNGGAVELKARIYFFIGLRFLSETFWRCFPPAYMA